MVVAGGGGAPFNRTIKHKGRLSVLDVGEIATGPTAAVTAKVMGSYTGITLSRHAAIYLHGVFWPACPPLRGHAAVVRDPQ